MNISNNQIIHIFSLLVMVIILIHNNTSKQRLKSVWNVACVIVILNIFRNMYKTYKKENIKVKVI